MARTRRSRGRSGNSVASEIASELKKLALVKQNLPKQLKKTARKNKKALMQSGSRGSFGDVSSITTAPVAIGNSVRGAGKIITKTKNGVRVRGRDFMFSPIGTGSVQTWTLCGGAPLTPAAFADSVLANYQRMYMKFKFHTFTAHYITSSPTSANGDVMFYYSKDRTSVFLNQTSNQLLPFVFTDENTVLGPQWTNHSAFFKVTSDWKLTDYGMHDGIEEYADGEVFLLSKTTTTDSPGYVIFDYDVEFSQENFQPRLLAFPIPRILWYNLNMGFNAFAAVKGAQAILSMFGSNNISGVASTNPNGIAVGDIYKVIIDVTNSSFPDGQVNASNMFEIETFGTETALTLSDGFTCYALYYASNSYALASSIAEAATINNSSNNTGISIGRTYNPSTVNLQCWVSYVASVSTLNLVPTY